MTIETSQQEFTTALSRIYAIQSRLTSCPDDQKRALNTINLRMNNVLNDLESVLIDLETLGGES